MDSIAVFTKQLAWNQKTTPVKVWFFQRVEKLRHCEPVLHSDALRAAFGGCALHAACGPCVVAIPRFFEHSLFKTATFPSYLGDRHTSLRAGSR
jgi:hypothetical protein